MNTEWRGLVGVVRQGNREEVTEKISKNTLGSIGIQYHTASSFFDAMHILDAL